MTGELVDRFRRWFDYEQDAHAKVLASFDTVPVVGRDAPEYRKAVGIMAHVVAARRMWLSRFGAIPAEAGSLFPEDCGIARVAAEWRTVQGLWVDHLARVDDAALARVFEYKSLDGGRFRNRVEDIFAQLFGHSSYHRGQIAMLIRAAGGQPAITDLIYRCREPVSDAGA